VESIIVYFIIFLVISALMKRLTQARSKSSGEAKVPPRRPSGQAPQRPVPPSVRPRPATYPPRPTEVQEGRVPSVSQVPDERRERRISIAERIREEIERAAMERMQEQGEKPKPPARKATQQKSKPSVQERIQEKPKLSPVQQTSPATRKKAVPLSPLALRFDPRSVRQGIIFSEILGPPRAERF